MSALAPVPSRNRVRMALRVLRALAAAEAKLDDFLATMPGGKRDPWVEAMLAPTRRPAPVRSANRNMPI